MGEKVLNMNDTGIKPGIKVRVRTAGVRVGFYMVGLGLGLGLQLR